MKGSRICRTIVWAIVLIIALTGQVYSAGLSKEPIFRIETGMHTAPVRRLGIDRHNKFIVTSSDDKTVRIWDFATGELLKILRPPIGENSEGSLYAVAMSPDGSTIACGGWTFAGDIQHNIYLFDRETGKVKGRIPGLMNVIRHLRYSPDGRHLVAVLGGKNGFRVFRTSDNMLMGEDKDYGSDCFGADFDKQNHLAVVSYDGMVRLYGADFKLITKAKPRGGTQPFSVSFSPDGSKIAVGFHDSPNVDILSGSDLAYLYSPNTRIANNGTLEIVSWSADGSHLYGGGTFQDGGQFPILKWPNEGKGSPYPLIGVLHSIMDLLPAKEGGIVFTAAGPVFGHFDRTDKNVLLKSPVIPDYRSKQGFSASPNGFIVQFEYDILNKTSGKFNVSERTLQIIPDDGKQRDPKELEILANAAKAMGITDWEDSYQPKVKGTSLKLAQYEFSRNVAVNHDKTMFILGTGWNLRLYDATGAEKWCVPIPSTPWAIHIADNGKVALAALGDGTVRWYRINDGKNILSLFPHKDKRRWVLWTSSGYYDASAGAEELIGWHMNTSPDTSSDFFPISRFRNMYYRPDVIEKVMETLDDRQATKVVEEETGRKKQEEVTVQKVLPPVVSIISPANSVTVSQQNVLVKYAVRCPSGEPVTEVRVMVNGRPMAATRDLVADEEDDGIGPPDAAKPAAQRPTDPKTQTGSAMAAPQVSTPVKSGDETRQVTVTIPQEDSRISIIALNRFAASEPATITVKWQGRVQKEEFVVLPKLYILAVGIAKYGNFPPENQLKFAAKDAHDFVESMKTQKGTLYRDVDVHLLADDAATRDAILDGLEWIQRSTTSKDVAMVFLSGHGVNDNTGVYYFVPTNFDKKAIKRTGVPYGDIKNTIANLAGKTLVFVDTCHSGNVMGTRKALGDVTSVANELSSAENGAIVFASSTGRQYSLERPEWNNGAFTKALIEGLSGKADYTKKGKISINMIDLYLSERVKELTDGQQTPTTTKPQTIQDFPIAVVK
jgi:WD40 repeat protein